MPDKLPSLSAFFPVYNEKEQLPEMVRRLREVLPEVAEKYEIIIVNDGSKDGSAQLADAFTRENPGIRAVHHERNQGYGAAIASGIRAASLEYIFYTDGDCQFDVAELKKFIPHIKDHDIVAGYRANRQDNVFRKVVAKCWTVLVNVLMGTRVRDMDCAFKLFRAGPLKAMDLKTTGNMISAEILTLAARRGLSVHEMPVTHFPRTAGEAKGVNLEVITRAFRELLEFRKRLDGRA